MKKTIFAVVALLMAVFNVGCSDDSDLEKGADSQKVRMSVTTVTENSITVSCNYTTEKKGDAGYLVFRSDNGQVTDEMRSAMVEAYNECEPLHQSTNFTLDKLASDRIYYIMAVAYTKKDGKVSVDNVTTLSQRTLATNGEPVSYTTSGKQLKLTIQISGNWEEVNFYDVFNNSSSYDLNVKLGKSSMVIECGDNSNYDKDKGCINCTVDCSRIIAGGKKEQKVYAYIPDGNKYKKYEVLITVTHRGGDWTGEFEVLTNYSGNNGSEKPSKPIE